MHTYKGLIEILRRMFVLNKTYLWENEGKLWRINPSTNTRTEIKEEES